MQHDKSAQGRQVRVVSRERSRSEFGGAYRQKEYQRWRSAGNSEASVIVVFCASDVGDGIMICRSRSTDPSNRKHLRCPNRWSPHV